MEAAGVGPPQFSNCRMISRTRYAQSAGNDRKPRCRYKTSTANPPPPAPIDRAHDLTEAGTCARGRRSGGGSIFLQIRVALSSRSRCEHHIGNSHRSVNEIRAQVLTEVLYGRGAAPLPAGGAHAPRSERTVTDAGVADGTQKAHARSDRRWGLARASRTPMATRRAFRIACGRGGQPGMYTSTGSTRSTPPSAA